MSNFFDDTNDIFKSFFGDLVDNEENNSIFMDPFEPVHFTISPSKYVELPTSVQLKYEDGKYLIVTEFTAGALEILEPDVYLKTPEFHVLRFKGKLYRFDTNFNPEEVPGVMKFSNDTEFAKYMYHAGDSVSKINNRWYKIGDDEYSLIKRGENRYLVPPTGPWK